MWCDECYRTDGHDSRCPNSSELQPCARCEELTQDTFCKDCKIELEADVDIFKKNYTQEEKDYIYDYITSEGV
jgi:hypothetical protein